MSDKDKLTGTPLCHGGATNLPRRKPHINIDDRYLHEPMSDAEVWDRLPEWARDEFSGSWSPRIEHFCRDLAQANKKIDDLRKAACGVMPYLWAVDDDGGVPYCTCCGDEVDKPHEDDCETDTLRRVAGLILTKRGWSMEADHE